MFPSTNLPVLERFSVPGFCRSQGLTLSVDKAKVTITKNLLFFVLPCIRVLNSVDFHFCTLLVLVTFWYLNFFILLNFRLIFKISTPWF
jgi:hypothetical protein